MVGRDAVVEILEFSLGRLDLARIFEHLVTEVLKVGVVGQASHAQQPVAVEEFHRTLHRRTVPFPRLQIVKHKNVSDTS